MNKQFLCVAAATLFSLGAIAETYYVDRSRPDDSGDGKTEATAKRTIQAAIDIDDATDVIVLPGVYDEGKTPSGADGTLPTRVKITKKITLTARDGKEKTFIVGRHSTDASAVSGTGPGAERCVLVKGAEAKGTIIEGFTICNGGVFTPATDGSTDISMSGAGVYVDTSTVGADAYICDCVLSNCVADSGCGAALLGGTAVASLIAANSARSSGSSVYKTKLSNCVVTRNAGYYSTRESDMVNCTVLDCETTAVYPAWGFHTYVMNSVFTGSSFNGPSDWGHNGGCIHASNTVSELMSGCRFNGTKPKVDKVEQPAVYEPDPLSITNALRYQCVGPAIGDFRLLPTSQAIGVGDPKYLSFISVPEKYRNRDFYGRPIVADENGRIQAGASQTVIPALASGKTTVVGKITSIDGFPKNANGYDSYFYLDPWPRQVLLTSSCPKDSLYGFYDGILSTWYYPQMDGRAWWTPPPAGTDRSIYAVQAKGVYYVDKTRPDDTGDGKTPAAAKRTIQAAVDFGKPGNTEYALVWVAPGVYDEGGRKIDGLDSRVVISNKVRVVALGSPADTFIVGAPDPDTQGYGPKATRGVVMHGSQGCVQGFTVTGCWTDNVKPADGVSGLGGAFYSTVNSHISYALCDCVITNNHAYRGSATQYGSLIRCRVTDNPSTAGMTSGGILLSSLFTREKNITYLLRDSGLCYNCTLDGTSSSWTQFVTTDMSLYNCILRNGYQFQPYGSTHEFFGNVLWGSSYYKPEWGRSDKTGSNEHSEITMDPILVDSWHFDCRPAERALAGKGDSLVKGNAWRYASGDIDGNPLILPAGGVPMPGAAQTFAAKVFITNLLGAVKITNGAVGVNAVGPTKTITIEATEAATRPFLGFRVDGVLLDRTIWTLTVDESYDGKTVEVVYTADWYVDANNGDDTADGKTPETARKTLEKAFALPLRSGDTVHAAEGVYDKGSMTNGVSFYHKGDGICNLPSRVVVPKGVTLLADEGAEKTFIVGAAATDTTRPLCLGPGAMRCVTLMSGGSTVKGFTITGGHTLASGDITDKDLKDDDINGGGVMCWSTGDGFVEDCVISNNFAGRGGAALCVDLIRCRIADCDAQTEAAGGWVCHYIGTSVNHFRTGKAVLKYFRTVNGCTFGPDITDQNGVQKSPFSSANDSSAKIVNSVVLTPSNSQYAYGGYNLLLSGTSGYVPSAFTNLETIALADVPRYFDTEGRPIAGSGCPALGLADPARMNAKLAAATDVEGNPRFSNNALDAGAFQSDWRKRYARVLGGGQTLCPQAATNVHEVVEGVRLETGSLTLSAKNAAKAAGNAAEVAATVDGTGTLKVLLDGEVFKTLTKADSPTAFTVPFVTGFEEVTFVYEPGDGDSGSATLNRCRIPRGMLLLVR